MSVGVETLLYCPVAPRQSARHSVTGSSVTREVRPEKSTAMSTTEDIPVPAGEPDQQLALEHPEQADFARTEPEQADSAHAEPAEAEAEPAPDTEEAAPPASAPRKRRLSILAILLIVAGVLAIAGWTAFGLTLAAANSTAEQLTASKASGADLSDRNDQLTKDLGAMTTSRDGYKADADDVAARETKVAEREKTVKAREDAITAKEKLVAETTLQDGYAYSVGLTAQPGVYQANSASSRCYWAIYTSGTNYSDIVENDLGSMGVIRVTIGGGQDFKSNSCGDWTKVG